MIEYQKYTLGNGLRVIHRYDPSTVMTAVDVLYDTGARDESRSMTGIAHLFEHLMFGGSINIPNFDRELENAGGTSNAWTSSDFTNFHDLLPAVNVETAFHLESDRMLSLSFSEEALEVQRSVVIEEFRQTCLNRPYGDLMHGLRKAVYNPEHPYSWPVIGIEPQHIASVTNEDVRRWFYEHYAPNNAVLAISGNLPYDKGRELVERWFGDIPVRDIPRRRLPDPGFPKENVNVEMRGRVPGPLIVIAIPMERYGTLEYRVTDCITDILSAGRASRLMQNIVLPGVSGIIEADASIIGSEEPGLLLIQARLRDNADSATVDNAAKVLLEQLENLSVSGSVSDYELQRTLNRFESTFVLGNLDILSIAQNLALAEIHGEDINRTVEIQRGITCKDITEVAGALIKRPRITLSYLPLR